MKTALGVAGAGLAVGGGGVTAGSGESMPRDFLVKEVVAILCVTMVFWVIGGLGAQRGNGLNTDS